MKRGRARIALALAPALALALGPAGCGSDEGTADRGTAEDAVAGAPSPAASPFWAQREASYRATRRGPFTAIRADYLRYREPLRLFVVGDSLTTDPDAPGERGAAIIVRFAEAGFAVAPADDKGWIYPSHAGKPVTEIEFVGKEADDEADVRVGRFLLSFGLQGEGLGRVVSYDPDLFDARFRGFSAFPDDDRWRVVARVLPGDGETVTLGTTRGLEKPFVRAARLEMTIDGRSAVLSGFRAPEDDDPALFVPFTDATTGGATYGVGRYLRVEPGADGTTLVDFNRATNPWCAYSPFYNCVLPPEENRLEVAVQAGERAPAEGAAH